MKFSLDDLHAQFPNERACLEYLVALRYDGCLTCKGKLYPVNGTKKYACSKGHIVSPMAGTILEGSSTPLTKWFYAIYLLTQSKSGISAAQLSRQLGVTYKCAFRMAHKIRELMSEGGKISGTVQVDETFVRAKPWRNTRVDKRRKAETVMALVNE